jgi:integrase/recombinase XerD
MPLVLYRRHAPACRVHTLGLSAREVRHYRDCSCPVWISGLTDDNQLYPRQSLHTRDWGVAEARARAIQANAADVVAHGPTIRDCVQRHLATHTENIGPRALEHHRLTLTRFEEFAHNRNKIFMSDLSVDLVEDFKSSVLAKFKSTTRFLAVAKLKVFLRESYRRGWITEPLALKVRSPQAVYEQALPYTEDEIARVLDEADRLDGGRDDAYGYASQPHTFRLLVELMLETGLRVSDAIRYDPTMCTRGEHLWVYRFEPCKQRRKTAKPHTADVFLSDRLHSAITAAVWLSPRYPFAYRPFNGINTMERQVYEDMQTVGRRCGVEDCRPHRLRDTFAVRMLVRGVPLEEVSHALGHSSIGVTQKHYAPWVAARRNRLEGLLAQALVQP